MSAMATASAAASAPRSRRASPRCDGRSAARRPPTGARPVRAGARRRSSPDRGRMVAVVVIDHDPARPHPCARGDGRRREAPEPGRDRPPAVRPSAAAARRRRGRSRRCAARRSAAGPSSAPAARQPVQLDRGAGPIRGAIRAGRPRRPGARSVADAPPASLRARSTRPRGSDGSSGDPRRSTTASAPGSPDVGDEGRRGRLRAQPRLEGVEHRGLVREHVGVVPFDVGQDRDVRAGRRRSCRRTRRPRRRTQHRCPHGPSPAARRSAHAGSSAPTNADGSAPGGHQRTTSASPRSCSCRASRRPRRGVRAEAASATTCCHGSSGMPAARPRPARDDPDRSRSAPW